MRGSGESPVTVGRNYPQPQGLGLPLLDQTSPHTPASLASLPQFFQNSLLLLKYQELQFNCPDHCLHPLAPLPALPLQPPTLAGGTPLQASFTSLQTGAHVIFLQILDLQQDSEGKLQQHWEARLSFETACEGHVEAQDIRRAAQSQARGQHQGTARGRARPLPRGQLPLSGGAPDSQPLLWDRHPLFWVPSEGRLRGTAGPLRFQRPNGMQIGICSLKDVLCMDFLLDFTWKLIIHHPSRACTKSGLCQQFLVSWDLMPNSSPSQGGLGDTKGLERGRGGSRNHFRASSEAVWSWLGGGGAKMGRRGLTRRSRGWNGLTKDAAAPSGPL